MSASVTSTHFSGCGRDYSQSSMPASVKQKEDDMLGKARKLVERADTQIRNMYKKLFVLRLPLRWE